jgi:predicted nuclease of predicted toxin-antitoxin system
MKLLVDNQLPVQLARYLCERGHDCAHVLDLRWHEATDLDLWNRCIRQQRILISKDQDFVFLANRPDDVGRLIWLRMGNCRNDNLIRVFEGIHGTLAECFASGQRIVEVR